jgi:hypothetical protein
LLHGANLQLTATITGTAKTAPTGTVTFLSGTTQLGSVSVGTGGIATLSAPLLDAPVGVDALTASYSGDTANNASVSTAVNVTVQSQTTTTVSLAPASIAQGQAFVVTATVARVNNTGNPSGSVTFLQGNTSVGTGTLANGAAQITLPSAALAQGTYNLSAQFAGTNVDLASASQVVVATVTAPLDVLTYRNGLARNGVQAAETILTPTNVGSGGFGKVYSFTTDGYAYAQPLYVAGYQMNDGNYHNVLFVETAEDSVYAFDADNNNPSAGYLWHVSLIPSNEQIVTSTDVSCNDIVPHIGIIGTPVIDRAKGVMYVVAKTKLVSGNTTTYYQRLHALNLADGTEQLNGPTVIAGSVPGTGVNSVNGMVSFDAFLNNQRAALAETNGSVYIAWASHCDNGNYHGWVMGYNASDISQQTGVYATTPNGEQGGIWMAGGGISGDDEGNIYVVSGNGTFDGNSGSVAAGQDLSDSVQRLSTANSTLTLADWFSPTDQAYLSDNDQDMGTVDGMLIDDPGSGIAPHLLVTADKTGRVYLINRDSMGGYDSGPGGANGDIQDQPDGQDIFMNFAYFNGQIYIGSAGLPLEELELIPGTSTTAASISFNVTSYTKVTPPGNYNTGGFQPVISANGTSDAIAWGMTVGGSTLYAWDATNLNTQFFASSTNATRDAVAPVVKFTVPTVANGHVYLAGQGAVMVYGLLQ